MQLSFLSMLIKLGFRGCFILFLLDISFYLFLFFEFLPFLAVFSTAFSTNILLVGDYSVIFGNWQSLHSLSLEKFNLGCMLGVQLRSCSNSCVLYIIFSCLRSSLNANSSKLRSPLTANSSKFNLGCMFGVEF